MKDNFTKEPGMDMVRSLCQASFNIKEILKMTCQVEWVKQSIIMVINIMGYFIKANVVVVEI
jgi:hypothetical protein